MQCIDELVILFNYEIQTNRRAAAETAYALAVIYRNNDVGGCRKFDVAGAWALRSMEILDDLAADTIEQVASTRLSVGGVPLPDLLHSGVVRQRLVDVLVLA